MIPPIAFKIGLGVIGAAAIAGSIWAYNERQRSIGDARTEAKHTEQVQEQLVVVERLDDAQAVSRMEGLERMIAEKEAFHAAMLKENRQLKVKLSAANSKQPEVIHEVQFIDVHDAADPTPCVVPNDLVDRVDYLAGVLNKIPYDRVPDSRETDTEPTLQGFPPIACTALVDRIETLTSRLGNVLIGYRELSDQAMKQWQTSEAFKKAMLEP